MGLAGPSKKRKISHDPNNTKWTRSTGFGHRMLTSQGWSPGTILGPDPNNPHHTVASQVGIKVMLKDDTLGLGCKGSQEDTCTGLGDLQSLLGRLNGKTDESVRSEEDTRRKMWIEGRYGMRFVKGEVLESTWVTKGLKKEADDVNEDSDEEMKDATEEEPKSADTEEDDESETLKGRKDKLKEKKRKDRDSKKKKRKSSGLEDDEDDNSSSSSKQDRKSDKAKRKADKALRKAEKQAKKERKEAKRLRKDEKRRAKAEKKALKSAIAASSAPSSTASTPPAMPSAELEPVPKPEKKAKSLPNSLHTSGTSTPVNGRQALRSKWIAQKKMAVMDAKALNEILMIKAA